MMGVDKHRSRGAARSDFLQEFAVGHLCKTQSPVFDWRGRPEHADAAESIDDLARNIRLSIYFHRIEMFVEKSPKFRERPVQLCLLRCRDARKRHHPIGNEMTLEETFGKTKRLWPCKKQFLRLLNFFLPLRADFVHRCTKDEIERNASCIPGSFRIQCKRRTRPPGSPYRCHN